MNRTKKMASGEAAAERSRVYALWDELAEYSAAQTDAALVHLMRTLCGWLKADNAVWVAGVRIATGDAAKRDAQHGWRGRAVRHLEVPPGLMEASRKAVRGQDSDPGMTTCAVTAEEGAFRQYQLRDGFVDFEKFSRTAHYQAFYESMGISDRFWTVCPVSRDAEVYYLFDLCNTRRRFSADDIALAGDTLRGLKRLHRDAMLSYGLLSARTALSPVQRRLLAELLTERSEKEIAEALRLTPGTTHQYVVALCRKLGVNGRAGLVAAWLGRPPPPPPPTAQ